MRFQYFRVVPSSGLVRQRGGALQTTPPPHPLQAMPASQVASASETQQGVNEGCLFLWPSAFRQRITEGEWLVVARLPPDGRLSGCG